MVEKKQSSEKKRTDHPIVPKKATTGAWWKSSTTTAVEEQKKSPPKQRRGRSGKSLQDYVAGDAAQIDAGVDSVVTGSVEAAKIPVEQRRPEEKAMSGQRAAGKGRSDEPIHLQKAHEKSIGRQKKRVDEVQKMQAGRDVPRKQTLPSAQVDQKGKPEGIIGGDGPGEDIQGQNSETVYVKAGQAQREHQTTATQAALPRPPKELGGEKNTVSLQRQQKESIAPLDTTAENQESDMSGAGGHNAQSPDLEAKQSVDGDSLDVSLQENEQSSSVTKHKEDEKSKPVIKLLVNAEEPEECRLALLEDGRLESIHVATSTRTQTKNNIYKARIVAIEPNLQVAFVDYGTDKNGFLPFNEIHPEYYRQNVSDKVRNLIERQQWKKLSINDVMEKGTEVLVQVVKEEVGKKGANMTTYLSLPGRCVVLMPGSESTGISRKISGEERRSKLRSHILSMDIPQGIGWIVRTASVDITKTALARDVNYLLRLWGDVKKKGQELDGVGLIYQDHDHVLRFLRENFDPDIQEIMVDDKEALEKVESFVKLLPAKQRKVKCKLHRGTRPIFNQYSIEDQIESIYQPKVNLPSGGSIVIDPTEALVSIDVNSGSTSKGQNFEETIFQANMEAARELARQLRLRDLGGLVVVDFIDMRLKKNIREVERQVKVAMKRDKAKVDISKISKFGLMQISRQKLGAPIEAGNYRICNHCNGRGMVRSVETLALYYLRRIHTAASRKVVHQIECRFPLDVAQYLLNNKRHELRELETKYATEVVIIADPAYKPAAHTITYHRTEKDVSAQKRS